MSEDINNIQLRIIERLSKNYGEEKILRLDNNNIKNIFVIPDIHSDAKLLLKYLCKIILLSNNNINSVKFILSDDVSVEVKKIMKDGKEYTSYNTYSYINYPENINEPIKNINEPIKNINEPIKNINEPIKNINEPIKNIDEPIKNIDELPESIYI